MTVQNVKEAITTFENLNPSDTYAYEAALHCFMKIRNLPFIILEMDKPFDVFRTRTHETDDFFQNVSDITIPQARFIKSFARCNRPFQPMFYCSDFRPTSYFELVDYWAEGKHVGDIIYATISKWSLTKPIRTLIVSSPHAHQRTSPYDLAHGHAVESFINQYDGEYREAMKLFYEYIFSKFRKPAKKDPKTYLITSAYCALAFVQAGNMLDAVFYPSVPFNGEGVNFAISNNFDFSTNFEPILVARNKLIITDFKPEPVFTEAELVEAKSINLTSGIIEW